MISRPAMVPAVRLEQPQVRFPADSNLDPQAIQRRTLMTIGESPASLRATFFCSISLTTLGGKLLILLGSCMPGACRLFGASESSNPSSCSESLKKWTFCLNISNLICGAPNLGMAKETMQTKCHPLAYAKTNQHDPNKSLISGTFVLPGDSRAVALDATIARRRIP